jgi:prefoldin subunit 5
MLQETKQTLEIVRHTLQVHRAQLDDIERMVAQVENMVTNMLSVIAVVESDSSSEDHTAFPAWSAPPSPSHNV